MPPRFLDTNVLLRYFTRDDEARAERALRGLRVTPPKPVYRRGLALYVAHNVSFADAFNAAYMEWRGAAEVYSRDEDFDRLPGTVRVEPAPEAPGPAAQGPEPP